MSNNYVTSLIAGARVVLAEVSADVQRTAVMRIHTGLEDVEHEALNALIESAGDVELPELAMPSPVIGQDDEGAFFDPADNAAFIEAHGNNLDKLAEAVAALS